MNVIEFNNVWKKFKRGEKFNSLRDAVPNFFRNIASRNRNNEIIDSKEFWALRDVSFQAKRGDVLGIIGPNGAGKSTILNLLSGIMIPNRGEVKTRGRMSALIQVTAGFHEELTGRENIYLNGTILGMSKREIDEKFDEIVEFSGYSEFIDTPVKRYSSGMLARLGFSVAAHMDPEILLVDEVLAVGDMAFQAKCASKMRAMLSSGTTIVLVSHNLFLVHSLCRRVILLNKGQILKEGTAEEAIPCYQNIVYKNSEEELRKKVNLQEYKIKLHEKPLVKILGVFIRDGERQEKENIEVGDPISVKVEYETREKIDRPVFSLDIFRNDGVHCSSSNTKDGGFFIESIKGRGLIKIDLTKINLAPGIYFAQVCIWDKDLIHPYAVKKDDIFRIKGVEPKNAISPLLFPEVKWNAI